MATLTQERLLVSSLPTATDMVPKEKVDIFVRPSPNSASLQRQHRLGMAPLPHQITSNTKLSTPLSHFENVPVEIADQILSYLIHPRSRLPGLTEAQSNHDFPNELKSTIKAAEDLTQPPDLDRWGADIFSLHLLSHPFNALSLTSRRCYELVENYCSHLVRACNGTMFNLPFAQLDKYGPKCVYPDMSGIVYRRLWLQHAPRRCINCWAVLDCYPFTRLKRLLTTCGNCFYRQSLEVSEVQQQYHISSATVLASPNIRGNRGSHWVLRVDVEVLAWQLYRTRAFHNAHKEQFGKPCSICAITRFLPEYHGVKLRPNQKTSVRQIARLRSTRRIARS